MTPSDLSKLTPEEKRVRIAAALGWRVFESGADGLFVRPPEHMLPEWAGKECPDYLNDLKAIAEAEKTLTLQQRIVWHSNIYHVVAPTSAMRGASGFADIEFQIATATAAQRADAFLLTI